MDAQFLQVVVSFWSGFAFGAVFGVKGWPKVVAWVEYARLKVKNKL